MEKRVVLAKLENLMIALQELKDSLDLPEKTKQEITKVKTAYKDLEKEIKEYRKEVKPVIGEVLNAKKIR